MSRIIIKNIPKTGIKEDQLKKLFGDYGTITDCSLKYTKSGQFRQFAFIGYESEKQAYNAVNKLNKSFIGTSRIQVEIARDFGDANKPRAWSKYSKDSSAAKKLEPISQEKEVQETKQDKKTRKQKASDERVNEMLGELKDDPEFQEFLEVHQNRSTKASWKNDTIIDNPTASPSTSKTKSKNVKVNDSDGEDDDGNSDGDSDSDGSSDSDDSGKETKHKAKDESEQPKKKVSDLEFLKSKMTKSKLVSESEDSDKSDSDDSDSDDDDKKMDVDDKQEQHTIKQGDARAPQFVIKMKGLPPNVKEKQIAEFFKPLKPKAIKVPRSAKGNKAFSFATVEFDTDQDTDAAMGKNKNFIGPKKIYLYKVKREVKQTNVEQTRPWENRVEDEDSGEQETIAESGRLYVRNLAYVCKEPDLEALFGKYGPLTEVHLPVDSLTKKVKGFAFITYMIPEHAVKAFSELDGSVFQGRMMHILPGKSKKEEEIPENAPFKKKKEAQMKKLAGSSHNWNTLFVGASSVADVMADKYGTSKSKILDAGAKQSLGVRMALGETQVVSEIREFLIENGVVLDSFSQAAAERSKTVILVKNLPAGTQAEEIRDLFSRHGTLGRCLLPPAGVTAIVEFIEPSEARTAFRNLAYTKFQHLPLYLEWAPVGVFNKGENAEPSETTPKESKPDQESSISKEKETSKSEKDENEKEENDEEEEEGEESGEPQMTLFIKNINFNTTEETIQKKFSKCGRIKNVSIAKKKDLKNPGKMLSMGYGFVEYKKKESAEKALRDLQHCMLDGHQLELKFSNRTTIEKPLGKQKQEEKKQTTSKILVRNIPFEAKQKEVQELFGTFGELKSVRLPKKISGTGSHRGFAFVDFLTKQDAKRAFNALCHDTHLYGRRLVLEWADSEESVDQLRQKTAQHFHDGGPSKKLRKSDLLEELHLGSGSVAD